MVLNGVNVIADPALTDEEISSLVAEEISRWQNRDKQLGAIELNLDGDNVVVKASEKSPIIRVRRITGYLSTLDQFNDAKRAECAARIQHAI